MNAPRLCPTCGSEIPADSPAGMCPACLLQAGLAQNTGEAQPKTAAYSPSGSGFVPPAPEALQPAFPQLEIIELLGKGGMGAVYKARQPGLDRLVAVKILPREVSRDATFIERFTREARALARLNHPNIVGVFDFGQADGFCYIVMEYVDGVNLRQAMRAGDLKPAESLKIVPQICDALQYAHDEAIVHRDIKPENILLDIKGRVKIADFGLAKLLGKTAHDFSLTGTQQVMGTVHYMAPEQLEGARDVDHRADIYALGVTFYEMLTGELPIGRFALPSQKVQIDVRLDEVVLRALEKAPEQRYQRAGEIKTEMETIAREKASLPEESTAAPEPAPVSRPVLVPLLALINLFVAALVASGAATNLLYRGGPPAEIEADEPLRNLYYIWYFAAEIIALVASVVWFAAGIGLLFWKSWARRATVATALFLIAASIVDIPASILVGGSFIAELAPEPVQLDAQKKGLLVLVGMGTIAGLLAIRTLYLLLELIYFTRPRVIAAFIRSPKPRHRLE